MAFKTSLVAASVIAFAAADAYAQASAEHDATALAKETQNPVSSLISLPFQFNFNTGGDLGDRT